MPVLNVSNAKRYAESVTGGRARYARHDGELVRVLICTPDHQFYWINVVSCESGLRWK